MSEEKRSFAQEMFQNRSEWDYMQEALYMLLRERYENGIEDIKSIDEYDYSIEFWIAQGTTLDTGDRKILWDIGFSRCWLCVRNGSKQDEVYYDLSGVTP